MQVARTPASDDKMPSQENKNTEEEEEDRSSDDDDQSQSALALLQFSLKFRSIYLQNSNLTGPDSLLCGAYALTEGGREGGR